MQKSDATPGSLQIPVSDQFWDHLGGFREVKSTQNRKKRVPKAHAKKQQIFGRAFFACGGPPGELWASSREIGGGRSA